MSPKWAWHRLLVAAVAVHAWSVWSVASQPLDGASPPAAPRFATARLHFDAVHFPGPGADFFALYHAGVQARRGMSPYDRNESPRVTPYFFKFIYSPIIAATLGRFVTMLAPQTAYYLWVAVIETCLAASLLVFWRSTRHEAARTSGAFLLLVSQPYILELHMGQFTFVAAALTMLAAALVDRTARAPRDVVGAAPLFLAAGLLKTFPFLALPAFARHRRGAVVALTAMLGLAAVAVWTWLGHSGGRFASGFVLIDPFDGPHAGTFSLLQTIFLLWLVATGTWAPAILPLLPLAAMVVTLGWTAWRVLRWSEDDVVLPAAVMLLAFFLAFLHVWEHHYSAVLLIGVFMLGRHADSPNAPPELVPRIAATLSVIAAPTPYLLFAQDPSQWSMGAWLLMSMSKAVPTAVLFAIGMRALRTQPHAVVYAP